MLYHAQAVFTRTTKGVREARGVKLPRDLSRIFSVVDGKATVAELVKKSGVAEGHCHLALEQLVIEGYIRVFTAPGIDAKSQPNINQPPPTQSVDEEGGDLDFTSAESVTKAQSEASERGKAEVEAEARQRAEAKTRAEAAITATAQAKATTAGAKAREALEVQMKVMSETLARAQELAAEEAAKREQFENEILLRDEAERKVREEADRRASAAEKAAAEARATAEEAQARAVAEAEGKVRAKARAQQEADLRKTQEAQREARELEMTRAREEADAHTRDIVSALQDQARQARQAKIEVETLAEAERAARAEIEARAKAQVLDAQAQVLDAQAQSARAQAESAAQAESERTARLAAEARADNERHLREAAVQQARAEVEALMAAEKEAWAEADAKAEKERLLRKQADQIAVQELMLIIAAERIAREQAEQQAAAARQARDAAEKRLLEMLASDPEQIRKTTAQAQADVRAAEAMVVRATATAEAATRAKVEAEAKLNMGRAASAAAEDRAKAEAVQRVTQELQSCERAETDIANRVARLLKAREDTERAKDAEYRATAEARARQSASERQARDVLATAAAPAPARKKNWLLLGATGAVVAAGTAIGLLHWMPLSGYVPGVQELMSRRLGQPVSITHMRYAVFPSPQLMLEHVRLGKLQDIKADLITVPLGPLGLVTSTRRFDAIEVKGVTLDVDSLNVVEGWVKAQTSASDLQISRVKFQGVALATRGILIPPFAIDASFGSHGELREAAIQVEKAQFNVTPKGKAWQVKLSANSWKPLIGPAVEFENLEATAVVDRDGATVSDIQGRVGGNSFFGHMKASWGATLQVSGDMKLREGQLHQLLPLFTRSFTSSGTVNLSASYAMSSTSISTLFDNVQFEGPFTITSGELHNVDIVRALQSAGAGKQRGGKTRFDTLSGTVQAAGNQYSYRQLQLNSGPMNASGAVHVNNGNLSGNINAELGTKGAVVARGTLVAGGSLQDPILR